jgi:hypothetical protein
MKVKLVKLVKLVERVQSQRVCTTTLRNATDRAVAARSCASLCKAHLGPPPAADTAIDGRRPHSVKMSHWAVSTCILGVRGSVDDSR